MSAGLPPFEITSAEITCAELDEDARLMAAALNFARRGWGDVAPNPAVGALLVKDGVVIGRGHTRRGGRPHAETEALRQAGTAAAGATLYVTLEPCSHHGETPPCAEAIVAADVGRVVSALDDPDQRVAGRGHRLLREAGIEVRTGVLADAARRANLGHIRRVTAGRPMVTLKLAETADGFAAAPSPAPRLAITGSTANARVHMWRAQHDAIMIGIGTALSDDPMLSVRLPGAEARRPLRIVLDTRLALPPTSQLALTAKDFPTLVVAGEDVPDAAATRLSALGIEVMRVRRDGSGRVDLAVALTALSMRGLTRIFSEGGPRVAAGLITQGFADEVIVLRSEMKLASEGVPALNSVSRALLEDPLHYRRTGPTRLGDDLCQRYERVL
jgi:diaminohydroxyphosphoribosylaminopyrimidine deaminase/5-amino-6-(5-phosphoribosylamino)uracil reductase